MALVNEVLDADAAERKAMLLAKLSNAADGFTPGLPPVAQCGEGLVENFVGGAKVPALDLLVDDAFLFGVECDAHKSTLPKRRCCVKELGAHNVLYVALFRPDALTALKGGRKRSGSWFRHSPSYGHWLK